MKRGLRRFFGIMLAFVMALQMAAAVLPVQVSAEEATAQAADTLYAAIEKQIRDYAKSINRADADDEAAWALAKHGVGGSGKKLSVGKSHALTATLMNSELGLATVLRGCAMGIRVMQQLGRESVFDDGGCNWGTSPMNYSTTIYPSADTSGLDALNSTGFTVFTGKTNAYDSSLAWMAASTEVHSTITREQVTDDAITYKVSVKFEDRFDFSTGSGSVPKDIASLLGSVLFKEFDWVATAEFSVTVPNECTHTSASYCWVYDAEARAMRSVVTSEFAENQTYSLSYTSSTDNKVYINYELEKTVTLLHSEPWVMEYTVQNPGRVLLSATQRSLNGYFDFYLYSRSHAFIQSSEWRGENYRYHCYGYTFGNFFNFNATQTFTIRLENVIESNGSNMVYMSVYNCDTQQTVMEPMPMDDYYINTDGVLQLQDQESKTLSGVDFKINYIKNLNTDVFELKVWVNGIDNGAGDYFTDKVTKPTCSSKGYTTHTCVLCGYSYKTDYVEKTSHSYASKVTPPTCASEGYTTYTCTACGDSFKDHYVDRDAHKYEFVSTEPTCTKPGCTTYTCTVCGHSYLDAVVEALGHRYRDWVVIEYVTCTENGYRQRECQVCRFFDDEVVEATGHQYNAVVTAPTCTKQGYTTYTCHCGDRFKDSYVDATGHSFGEWTEVKAPTCTEKGSERRDCANCNHFETREIAALGHKYEVVVTAPTCTEDGYTTHTCRCGDSYVDSKVDALGHEYGEWTEVKAPTCDAEGQDKRICDTCGDVQYRDTRISGDSNKILVSNPVAEDYFAGKTVLLIGDSITAGVGTTKTYGEYLAESLGVTVINKGASGSGYCSGGAMATNKHLTEANVSKADVITIMLGVNDWNWAVKDGSWNGKPGYYDESQTYYQLGNFNSTDTSTFYGALHAWCQKILAMQQMEGFEDKQFVVITPLITSWNVSVGKKDWNQDKLNIHGHVFREYCTAIMEVCAYYDIPVFDANMYSGIYYRSAEDNNVAETGGDGVHVNAAGHALLAKSLEEFLLEGYTYENRTVADCGHRYETVITQPTCTEDGYTTHKCPVCHYSYTDNYVDALGHKYESVVTAPTCTKAGYTTHTCAVCGDNDVNGYVPALGHDWDAGVVTKEPTETETGLRLHNCTRCDETKTETIPTLDHVHKYEAVVTAPTCTAQGYTTHTCRCGDKYVDSKVDALGHKLGDWETTKDATCTEDGSQRRDCERCDYFETEVVEATGHKYEEVVTAPTCTEDGYTTHTCHCGDSYVDSKVDALGHKLGDWETVKDATCTEDGSKRRDCERCDYFETEVIEATDHKYEEVVTAPTCTAQGYTTHTCHCGDSYVSDYVDALGHKLGNWETVKDATCTEDGAKRRDCDRCDYFETETIEATGHKYESVVTAPTCTEDGYTTYTCHCGDSYMDSKVDALGHTMGDWEIVQDATCTEDGSKRRDCDRCDYFETEVIEATGHKYEIVVTAPTCTEDGYTTHTCHCGDSYVDSRVDALGHKLGDWETVKAATCTEDGSQRRDCDRCDYFETEVVEATGHKYESVVTAPTCTAQGYTTHTCHCGDSYVDSKVDALSHKLGDWETVKAATCTEDGSKRRDCDRCDYFETEVIEATGHKYEAVVTAPTCTEEGYTTYTCECGDSYVDSKVDALSHKLGDWETVNAATCTEDGSKRRDCERCDYFETEAIKATGHKYESAVTAPTCTEDGHTTHTCHCGDRYVSDYVDALCHKYESVVAAPTCTEDGYTTHTCHCGDSYVDSKVDALGHKLGDWVTTKDATCTEKGSERRDCANCDHFETRETDALGHDLVTHPEQKPTCVKAGWEAYEACSRCDYTTRQPIPATGHQYSDTVIPPTCTAEGYTLRKCTVCGINSVVDYVDALGHKEVILKAVAPTCTATGLTEGSYCAGCGKIFAAQQVVAALGHSYKSVVTAPTCTKEGYTTYTCHCGHSYVDNKVSALGHKLGEWTVFAEPKPNADGEERRTCQRCDFYESRKVSYPGIMLKLEGEDLTKQKEVWIEGMPYPVITVGDSKYVELKDEKDFVMVTYTYQNADNPDVHTQYPTGMKVYKVSGDKITHIQELDNLLQYSGSSIRITGKKGIRMITSITKANKTALTGKGLAGYKLVEYGTALCWASEIKEGDALTLGKTFTRSNYAYKKGVADPIFATTKDLVQYTNVLVGFTNDQCKDDIAMRPYIILEDAKGEKITLYGGTVYRSIGYIAYQNRSVVKAGTEAYKYVWDIIHYVYGNKYDADYKG